MDLLARSGNYLRYLAKATNEHGVHSPFVYKLLTDVIYSTQQFYAFDLLKSFRQNVLASDQLVEVIDLGAGSKRKNTPHKRVGEIAKNAGKPLKFTELLFRLCNHFQPTTVLELGTSLGLSTAYMASAVPHATIITMEGSPAIAACARYHFERLGLNNIRMVTGNFDDVLQKTISELPQLDLVFFDGNHRKTPTLNYFELCLQKAGNDTLFIFDDIYWSKEMMAAWENIKQHPATKVTVDLFGMGLVFFRKEQEKQHFLIRF